MLLDCTHAIYYAFLPPFSDYNGLVDCLVSLVEQEKL